MQARINEMLLKQAKAQSGGRAPSGWGPVGGVRAGVSAGAMSKAEKAARAKAKRDARSPAQVAADAQRAKQLRAARANPAKRAAALSSPWHQHLAEVRAANPGLSVPDAARVASQSYTPMHPRQPKRILSPVEKEANRLARKAKRDHLNGK